MRRGADVALPHLSDLASRAAPIVGRRTPLSDPNFADDFHGPVPLCVDRQGLARMLGVSVRSVDRLDSSGKLPAAISLGRCKRWRIESITAWVAEGAPKSGRRNLRSGLAGPRSREQGQ